MSVTELHSQPNQIQFERNVAFTSGIFSRPTTVLLLERNQLPCCKLPNGGIEAARTWCVQLAISWQVSDHQQLQSRVRGRFCPSQASRREGSLSLKNDQNQMMGLKPEDPALWHQIPDPERLCSTGYWSISARCSFWLLIRYNSYTTWGRTNHSQNSDGSVSSAQAAVRLWGQ